APPTTYEGALLTGPNGAAYTLLRGVAPASPRAREEIQSTVTAGTLDAVFRRDASGGADDAGKATAVVGAERAANNTNGADDAPVPVVVGEELAARAGLNEVGDEGWIITAAAREQEAGFVPRARRVRVAGLFRSGLYEYDS